MSGIEELAALGAEWWGGLSAGTQTVIGGAATATAATAANAALQPKLPGVKPPVAMPDQQAVEDARRRSVAQQLARRGRASTILSDQSDALG